MIFRCCFLPNPPTRADLPCLLFILGAEWSIMFLRDLLEEVLCPTWPLLPFIMQIQNKNMAFRSATVCIIITLLSKTVKSLLLTALDTSLKKKKNNIKWEMGHHWESMEAATGPTSVCSHNFDNPHQSYRPVPNSSSPVWARWVAAVWYPTLYSCERGNL